MRTKLRSRVPPRPHLHARPLHAGPRADTHFTGGRLVQRLWTRPFALGGRLPGRARAPTTPRTYFGPSRRFRLPRAAHRRFRGGALRARARACEAAAPAHAARPGCRAGPARLPRLRAAPAFSRCTTASNRSHSTLFVDQGFFLCCNFAYLKNASKYRKNCTPSEL